MLSYRVEFECFLDDGRLEIDSTVVARASIHKDICALRMGELAPDLVQVGGQASAVERRAVA
jgi:hypothetical protein